MNLPRLFQSSAPPPGGLAQTAPQTEAPPGHVTATPGCASSPREPGNLDTSTVLPLPGRIGEPGAAHGRVTPGTFLPSGCTREESRLAAQIAWSRNLGDYTPGEYMTASLAYRAAGDHARADRCLLQIRVLHRREGLL